MREPCPQDLERVHVAPGDFITEADIARSGWTPYHLVAAGVVERRAPTKSKFDGTTYAVLFVLCLAKENPLTVFGCPSRKGEKP